MRIGIATSGAILFGLAAPASRADVVDIDFSEIPAGTTYVATTPSFNIEGVAVRFAGYFYYLDEDLEAEVDFTGTAEVQLAPLDFAPASGNALHTQRLNLVFDFTGEAVRIDFDYLDREPHPLDQVWHESYNINLSGVITLVETYLPNFREYSELFGGETVFGDMVVTETVLPNGDVYGHVTMIYTEDALLGPYDAFVIAGRDLWIDNLSVTAIPEPGAAMLSIAGLAILLRRRLCGG